MSSFTPGPWKWNAADFLLSVNANGIGQSNVIQPVEDEDIGAAIACNPADRALIAAAPDLFEALKEVVRICDRNTVEFDKARAALAKAVQS